MKYCSKCGKQLTDDARFCDGCGSAQAVASETGRASAQLTLPNRAIIYSVVGALVIAALAFGGWTVFFKPMSPSAYETQSDGIVKDLVSETNGWLKDVEGCVDGSEISAADIREAKDATTGRHEAIGKLHDQLEKMRPPSEYASSHRKLLAVAEYLDDTWFPQMEDEIAGMHPGNVSEIEDGIMGLWNRQEPRVRRAADDLSKAAADIQVDFREEAGDLTPLFEGDE